MENEQDEEPEVDEWAEFEKDCQKIKFHLSNEYCDWWFGHFFLCVENCQFYKQGKNGGCCHGREKIEYEFVIEDWDEITNILCALKQGGYSELKFKEDKKSAD
ncbi:MAG: hypothetical protein LBC64_01845 [Fibromonadaceae bacterium]|jgi:hypothetical protein|nr:hypothetical protein [Fibromonadaceae bacterium]